MLIVHSALGCCVLLAIAYLSGRCTRSISWKTSAWPRRSSSYWLPFCCNQPSSSLVASLSIVFYHSCETQAALRASLLSSE